MIVVMVEFALVVATIVVVTRRNVAVPNDCLRCSQHGGFSVAIPPLALGRCFRLAVCRSGIIGWLITSVIGD